MSGVTIQERIHRLRICQAQRRSPGPILSTWKINPTKKRTLAVLRGKSGNGRRPLVLRLYVGSVDSDTFYGDFMVKLVRRLSGFSWRKHGQSNFADNIHINFIIKISLKSNALHTVSILSR